MATIKIEVTDSNALEALQELERKHLIRILKEPDLSSYALPGKAIGDEDFKKWIEYTEKFQTVSVNEAKQKWDVQKEKLQKPTR